MAMAITIAFKGNVGHLGACLDLTALPYFALLCPKVHIWLLDQRLVSHPVRLNYTAKWIMTAAWLRKL